MKRFFIVMMCISFLCFSGVFAEDEDYIIAQPGDSGADVELILRKCADLGYLRDLPEGADEYLAEYEKNIMQMEKALGFTEDGVFHLSEFLEIETSFGVGSEGEPVREILEKLFELGYIRDVLPEPHDTYEKKNLSAVKNAEKKLGLHVDGFLTASELEKILEKPLEDLPAPAQLSVRASRGTATVSWKSVPGAVSYTVFRDDKKVATIQGKPSWTDEDTEMLETYRYKVMAQSYLRESKCTAEEKIDIPLAQTITKFTDRNDRKKITLTDGTPVGKPEKLSFSVSNQLKAGVTAVKVHSIKQQKLNNGYTRFIMEYTAPAGYTIAVFNPPNGSVLMLNSNRRTSSGREAVQFDISDQELKKISNTITINIVKGDKDRFFIFPKFK